MENKELLEEIYDKAVSDSEYIKQTECEVSRELKKILAEYKENLPEQIYLKLEEIVMGCAVAAEKVSFIAGVKYGMRLLAEGLIAGKERL